MGTQIRTKLEEIQSVFPGKTEKIVFLNSNGDIIEVIDNPDCKQGTWILEESIHTIGSLKKTALQFGKILTQSDGAECPVIHIRGSNNLFSCYQVNRNDKGEGEVIAFYTEMESDVMDSINLPKRDAKVQEIIEDLKPLVANLIIAPPKKKNGKVVRNRILTR